MRGEMEGGKGEREGGGGLLGKGFRPNGLKVSNKRGGDRFAWCMTCVSTYLGRYLSIFIRSHGQ